MRRILVTAVSGDIGNGIVEILLNARETVFACDINPYVACMCDVEGFYQSLFAISDGYISQLLEMCEKYKITHLIPTNEREIEVINKHRELFDNAGIKLVMQSAMVVDVCLDKYLTMQTLADNGIDIPKYGISLSELSSADSEKIVCKGRKSNGSKALLVFDGLDDFCNSGIVIGDDYILQNYIDGDEYTLGVFGHNGKIRTIAFRRTLANGHSHQVELVSDETLEEVAVRVAGAFKLEGYINIQMRLSEGKYYIFEINPRISGTVGFRDKLGFTDVLWWLDLLDGGESFTEYKQKYKKAIGVRYLAEKFVNMEPV